MSEPIQRSFAAGEVSPQLFGRVDHTRYTSGLKKCRNMAVMRHGGAVNRPSSQFIAEVKNSASAVRLIPFIFNSQAGQTYMLEFSNFAVRFYQNGGQVVESSKGISAATQANPCQITSVAHGYANGDEVVITSIVGMTQLNGRNFIIANVTADTFTLKDKNSVDINSTFYGAYIAGGLVQRVYTLVSPYAQADLSALKFAQTNDVMTIVHPSYQVEQLQRLGATNWQFVAVVFNGSPIAAPGGFAGAGTVGVPNPYYNYYITSVNSNGEETLGGLATLFAANGLALPTAAAPITLTWTPVVGAIFYRLYRNIVTTGLPSGGGWGYIGQAQGAVFVDTGITPDFTNVPWNSGPPGPNGSAALGNANNYPSAVGFIQQRIALAASNNNPMTVWLSVPGSFLNMAYHYLKPDDADAIAFTPASEQVNKIQHLVQMRSLLIFTDASEINVQGDSAGTLKPTAINPLPQSYFGSGSLKPIVLGDVCIFQQAQGWFVRDLTFDFTVDAYRGNDLTIFSAHLFQGYTLSAWAFQQIPHSIIWVARSDGTLLGLTYIREQQIFAWHRHDFTNGFVEDVACIPESPEHGVYIVVKRTINGVTKRYIERLSPFYWSDVNNAPYMDSWLSYDGTNSSAVTMTLTAPITSGWTYQEDITLTASASFFTTAMVGEQIFLTDSLGNQVRCQIKTYISGTQVTVTPTTTVPATLRNVAVTTWSHAIKTVSNLWSLEGQTISVFADRFVVGSPNNSHYPKFTVTNGQITLDMAYAKIYVGLPITSDVETLNMDTAFGDSVTDKPKLITRLAAYVYQTRGGFYGEQDPDSDPLNTAADPLRGLFELKAQDDRATYDAAPNLINEPVYINIQAAWNKGGRVFVRQVDPLPLQLLTIVPEGMIPTTSPYLKV